MGIPTPSLSERSFVHPYQRPTYLDTTIDHKAFESLDARIYQATQLILSKNTTS